MSDATFWRHIVWRHISDCHHICAWRHILTPHCLTPHFGLPPHLCLTPHCLTPHFGHFRRRHQICAWRHISTPHCLKPHFHHFGGATTFVPEATFWRRSVLTPHFHLTPHLDPHLETNSFYPPDFGIWNGTSYRAPFGVHVLGCCNWVGPCCLHRYLLLDFVSWILCIKLRSTE